MSVRILSGVQPSGILHLGNYFGAVQQHIELQNLPDSQPFYFIADFHAMTTVQSADRLREYSRGVAVDYLALGLDPARSVFFRQSDVPEVLELAWMLGCVTGVGLLERAHSYKDKIAKGIKPGVGLFYYPVLMAADILLYKAKWVPVGQDQVQHIEMTQDMAEHFNSTYGVSVFPRPEARLSLTPKVPGVDGEKMSKSYGNTIDLPCEGKPLRKLVMAIKTDSKSVEEPKDPEACNVFALFRLFATEAECSSMAARYRAGGYGYGEAKQELYEKIEQHFAPYRKQRKELLQNPDHVDQVLRDGARRAREVAASTLDEALRAAGIR